MTNTKALASADLFRERLRLEDDQDLEWVKIELEVERVKTYRVTWDIDIDADSPEDAARLAWAIMRAEDSTANVFDIADESGELTRVDLQEIVEVER